MAEIRRQLVEMGFSAGRIETALRNSDGTLEGAVQWLDALRERQAKRSQENWAKDPASAISFEKESTTSAPITGSRTLGSSDSTSNIGTKPIFKEGSNTISSFSTGTTQYEEENKPRLTPEEREKYLQTLRDRAAARKAEKEKELAKERRNNELIRKKNTKESAQATEELQKNLALKEAAKRRQEQLEDRLAKQRIKDLIEADKRERSKKSQ